MANEIVDLVLRINLALGAGVALVLALRLLARRYFGARIAYALWLLPLFAAAACFIPGRVEHIEIAASALGADGAASAASAQPPYLLWAWAAGAVLSLIILALRQFRYTRALGTLHPRTDLGAHVHAAQSAAHGPAVIGVIRPVIVTPADFDARFDAEEQRIVLAHERAHLAQGDPWINAIVLLLQCLNWFNPMLHIGARALRMDQELACDAAVLAQAEGVRRRYAEAMLKTHITQAAPLGCAWPPNNLASLKERIAMLKRNLPSRTQRIVGVSVVALAAAGVVAAAWAAQPPRIVATVAPAAAWPATAQLIHADEDDLMGAFDIDLDDDDTIIIDGEVMRVSDMTPEQREELRRSLEEARADVQRAMAEAETAREAAREALEAHWEDREAREEQIEAAMEAAAEARETIRESRFERLEALAEMRTELAASHAERTAAMAEARVAMREAQRELARLEVVQRDLPEVRAALAAANAEIAQAMEEARVEREAARVEMLRELERARLEIERETEN